MNSCMLARATPEEFDRSREEWFRLRIEKRKAKELAIKDGKVPPA